ncbi:uncharacterized protein K452DRAFT_140963 [Aplosporella prunicola CBS 121167]|uniref:Uncharacterized protein n=1 Tax=Aplosporella prunicola CBS 121167 TaxID=1176127 RepID=A0A6A6BM55_9PEZI|nr:uncharacterized protein K452DRAFT_140963 [Aplosporella prunicola CBS 121167]KAF2144364.1 hypothetical protein K452DRAFT_140963 [Aplosporella prunicola CBS 121167]
MAWPAIPSTCCCCLLLAGCWLHARSRSCETKRNEKERKEKKKERKSPGTAVPAQTLPAAGVVLSSSSSLLLLLLLILTSLFIHLFIFFFFFEHLDANSDIERKSKSEITLLSSLWRRLMGRSATSPACPSRWRRLRRRWSRRALRRSITGAGGWGARRSW